MEVLRVRRFGSGWISDADRTTRAYRVRWADLLRKVFALDVLACPECNGRMRLTAFIGEARVAKRILDHLGEGSTGPPLARAQAQQKTLEPEPDYGAADPIYPE